MENVKIKQEKEIRIGSIFHSSALCEQKRKIKIVKTYIKKYYYIVN
jgi:hypothetical protein